MKGASPTTGLIADSSGALFGVTVGGNFSLGSVYELEPVGNHYKGVTLYSFTGGSNGSMPNGPLVKDASGNLFGTAYDGGSYGLGLAFELTPGKTGYVERTIYSFQRYSDANNPVAGLTGDSTGALYGTTNVGGYSGNGTAFKLTPSGSGYTEQVIHEFAGPPNDGGTVVAPLIADAKGDLFGTTSQGGSGCNFGCGIVFELIPGRTGYSESVLYNFQGTATGDGATPEAGLIIDADGNLFGTTLSGGASNFGTAFELERSGKTYVEHVLHSFEGSPDGQGPYGPLVADAAGNLYGMTPYGGQASNCNAQSGCGTIFKLSPTASGYVESIAYNFQPGPEGFSPYGGLLIPSGSRYAYGTASQGGSSSNCAGGCGTAFELKLAQ